MTAVKRTFLATIILSIACAAARAQAPTWVAFDDQAPPPSAGDEPLPADVEPLPAPDATLLDRAPSVDELTDKPAGAGAFTYGQPDGYDHYNGEHYDGDLYDGGWIDDCMNIASSGEWLQAGRWYANGDFVMMHRAPNQNVILSSLSDGFNAIHPEYMSTDSDGFGYEPGMRFTIGRFSCRDEKNRDQMLEFTFLGLNSWSAGHTAVAPGGTALFSPLDGNVPGFSLADRHSYSYKSDLKSSEINLRLRSRLGRDQLVLQPDGNWQRQSTDGKLWSFLGGLRLISVNESFLFESSGGVNAGLTVNEGRYDLDVSNDAFGVQCGLEWYEQHSNWSFGARGKLGGLVNFADQRSIISALTTTATPLTTTLNSDGTASDEQLMFMAELSIVGTYQLRSNIALRVSYDFMYLQGLALAPEQLSFNTTDQTRINTGSYGFYDSASFGFEFVW
jgi:hypothetical protein